MLHDPEIWVLVAFLIVIALLARRISRMVTSSLDARAAAIRNELEEAQRLREEAQRMLAEYQRKQRDALQEAEQIIAHAKEEAERAGAQARKDLEAAIERRQRQAVEKIQQEEARALAEVRSQAVDIAMTAARRLIGEQLDARRGSALIDEAIAALPQRLH
jgi:F-type H+-transporting ATPase subunit b